MQVGFSGVPRFAWNMSIEFLKDFKPGSDLAACTDDLRRRVDSLLAVKHVEWKYIEWFVDRMDVLAWKVLDFGRQYPGEALDVLCYFIRSMPKIFDAVHDECELDMFIQWR